MLEWTYLQHASIGGLLQQRVVGGHDGVRFSWRGEQQPPDVMHVACNHAFCAQNLLPFGSLPSTYICITCIAYASWAVVTAA